MNKREMKIDILSQLIATLRHEVMHCELLENKDVDLAMDVQEEVAQELERRIARLSRSK